MVSKKKNETTKAPRLRKGAKVAKAARRVARVAAKSAVKSAASGKRSAMHPNQRSFHDWEEVIRAVSKDRRSTARLPFEDAIDVVLRTVEGLAKYEARMEIIDRAIPGTLEAFHALGEFARATRYAHTEYLKAQASEGGARVPEEIVKEAKTFAERMTRVIRYHLAGDTKIVDTLSFLGSGIGYRHQSMELQELSAIYENRHDDLSDDRKFYDPKDAIRARELAVEIGDLVGRTKGGSAVEWAELRASAMTLTIEAHDRIARLVAAIEFDEPADNFPTLASAVRSLRGPRGTKRTNGDDLPVPPLDVPMTPSTPPTVAPTTPETDDEETPA